MQIPNLRDILDKFKEEIKTDINCVGLGYIVEVDIENGTASIEMGYRKKYTIIKNNKNEEAEMDYPVMLECPIFTMGNDSQGFYYDIKKGDGCIILFNDRDIDNYVLGQKGLVPVSSRKHSFSDAIAIAGLMGKFKRDGDVGFTSGDADVNIKNDKITIKNKADNLGKILSDLLDAISDITVIVGSSTSSKPVNLAVFNLIKGRLKAVLNED